MDETELYKCVRAYDPSLHLGNIIGSGGTASVYELPGTAPAQVLKIMNTNCNKYTIEDKKKMRKYFRNEIETMKELSGCKYIMPVIDSYEYISDDNTYESVFLVRMKKMLPLTEYYHLYGLTEKLLIQLAIDICKALQICEKKHILHRDVKPDNIFISYENNKMNFVLGDFGFCRRLDVINGSAVTQCGTISFMAPEIFRRQPLQGCFNSDIYSLGVSLYHIVSNNFPSNYNEEGSETWEKLHGLSDGFIGIIRKASQANAKNRYQHASDMLDDLNDLRPDVSKDQSLKNKPYFFSAKQAMLKGRFDEAINYAEQGVENQEDGCKRLYAYCLYRNHNSESSWDKEKSEESVRILDSLAEEGDAVARCIRATIYYQKDEMDKFFINIKKSAEDGCAIAQYYYGRALYEGWAGRPRDTITGQYYLQNAAKENYLPALRFLKRILKNNPDTVINTQLADLMEDCSFDEERLRSDIVKFL